MPIYAYECKSCGEGFELLRSISESDVDIHCPKCRNKEIYKIISTFTMSNDTKVTTTVPSNEECAPSGSG